VKIHKLFFLLSALCAIFMSISALAQEDDVYLRVEGAFQTKGTDRYYKFYLPIRVEVEFEKKFEFPEFSFFEKVESIEIDAEKLFTRRTLKFQLEKKFEFQQLLVHKITKMTIESYAQKLKIPELEIKKRFNIPRFNEHLVRILIFGYTNKIPTIPMISILGKTLEIYNVKGLENAVDLPMKSKYDMTKVTPEIQSVENNKVFRVLNSINVSSSTKETEGSIFTKNFGILASEKDLNFEKGAVFISLPYLNYSTYGTENKISTMLQSPSVDFHSSVGPSNVGYTDLSFPIQILNIRGDIGFSISIDGKNLGLFPLFDFGFAEPNKFLGFKGNFEDESYNFKIFGIYNDLKVFGYIGYSLIEKLPTFGSGVSYDLGYLTPYIGFSGTLEKVFVKFGLTTGPFNFGVLNFLSKAFVSTNGTVKGTDIKISMETGSIVRNIMINLESFLTLSKGDLNYGGGISIQF